MHKHPEILVVLSLAQLAALAPPAEQVPEQVPEKRPRRDAAHWKELYEASEAKVARLQSENDYLTKFARELVKDF